MFEYSDAAAIVVGIVIMKILWRLLQELGEVPDGLPPDDSPVKTQAQFLAERWLREHGDETDQSK